MSRLADQIREAVLAFADLAMPPALIGGLALAAHQVVRATRDVVIASYALAATAGRLTARDLNLPVAIYDPLEYYSSTRNRWYGTDVPPSR